MPHPALHGLLALAVSAPVAPAGWPASAGPPPAAPSAVWKDPAPRRFDPPAGLYLLPDGSTAQRDPPPGHYDPPPGFYAVEDADAPDLLGPLPIATDLDELWLVRRQRLRVAFALTGGLVLASGVGLGVAFAVNRGSAEMGAIDGYPLGAMVFASLGGVALIACLAIAGTLGVHAGRRPQRRLQLAPGGLRLRF